MWTTQVEGYDPSLSPSGIEVATVAL